MGRIDADWNLSSLCLTVGIYERGIRAGQFKMRMVIFCGLNKSNGFEKYDGINQLPDMHIVLNTNGES